MISIKTQISLCVAAAIACGSAMADEHGEHHSRIPHLDHVFLIMLENHAYDQIIGNSDAPFINQMAKQKNLATNYFAVGHPSLTNYLEVVGGSNFGVINDHSPDWHNANCTPNLVSGIPSDESAAGPICPIAGSGMDAATVAVDTTNEGTPANPIYNVPLAAAPTVGKTIADQLVARGRRWKSYQESLPLAGADTINFSDGVYDNTTNFSAIHPTLNPPLSASGIVALYAVKHNPFEYFRSTQQGANRANSSLQSVGFDGSQGLYSDLQSEHMPAFSLIAPNQCNDQHGRGNAGPFCNYDPSENGTQAGLNPALIHRGDVSVQTIVESIKASPSWNQGRNAIVVVWDENDYSTAPNTNQVVLLVDTNYGRNAVRSARRYTHYSLLKTLEAGFGLPCLNHACDANVQVMSDLFASTH